MLTTYHVIMKTESKIIFGGSSLIIITIIIGSIFSILLSDEINNSAIKNAEAVNSAFILSIAKNQLNENNFRVDMSENNNQVFDEFFQKMKTKEMLRIKVWDNEGTIVYSDDKSIIGSNYGDNLRFKKAITGVVTTEIKDPVDAENISEMGYGQMMEIYIPINFESNETVGVIELYYNMDTINHSIVQLTNLILLSTLILVIIIISGIAIFSILTIKSANETLREEKFFTIGELASRLAHDIRNPLTIIKTSIDLIKINNDNLTEKDLEKISKINNAIYRISRQVENVLDFVRGKPLNLEKHSLQKIVNSVLEDLPKHDKIEIESVGEKIDIQCDYEAMKVVIFNIVFNAIQAIKDEGKITITSKKTGNNASITIQDDGPGIPEKEMSEIFEPLFTTKQEGTGLGLVSCKSIIEQHGGTISVTNHPTTFKITLPNESNKK